MRYTSPAGRMLNSLPNFMQDDGSVLTLDRDLHIDGDLTIDGAAVYMYTETVIVNDNIILLNNNVTGAPSEDAGLQIERGTSTNASLLWDETSDFWKAGLLGAEVPLMFAPASSTDNTIPRFDGTTGKLLQGSLVTIDDSNNQTIPATMTSIHNFTSANWTFTGGHWTMGATGPLVHVSGNTSTATATNTEAIVAGTTYKVTITGTGGGGTATYTLGGVTGTTIAASGAIAITDYITASTTASMIITPASACTVSITDIKIEKLTDSTGDLTVEGNLTVKSPITFDAQILLTNGSASIPSISFAGDSTLGFYKGSNRIFIAINNAETYRFLANQFNLYSDTAVIALGTGEDLLLVRNAADHLAMRNSTNPQKFSLFETYTDASNYESYSLDAGVTTADTFTIKGNTAGTGADSLSIALTPAGTGSIVVPTGTVTNPIIVSDDANSGFYFGSKGFNWSVDGVKVFGVDNTGTVTAGTGLSIANGYSFTGDQFTTSATNRTLKLQLNNFTAADNMVEMATGTATFTGFDGEIVGVNIMPIVGALDDGDTMTLLKLAPQGTPASTLGIVRGLAFGNWGGTGTDTAYMIDVTATGYDGVLNVTADATDPTGGGGAATGRIPIIVGGAVKYLAYY